MWAKSENRQHPKLFASFDVPQGSIPGPIFFNIFLNDLLEILKNSDIHTFGDDITISVASKNRNTLLETLKSEPESAVNQLRNNIINAN